MIEEWRYEIPGLLKDLERPFEWGVHDCCLSVAHVLKEAVGLPLYDKWVDRYHSPLSLRKALSSRFLFLGEKEKRIDGAIKSEIRSYFYQTSTSKQGDLVLLKLPMSRHLYCGIATWGSVACAGNHTWIYFSKMYTHEIYTPIKGKK